MQDKSRKNAGDLRVIVHDLLSLIDFVYWDLAESRPKKRCKGFDLRTCKDCKHFNYCQRRDLIKAAIEERLSGYREDTRNESEEKRG